MRQGEPQRRTDAGELGGEPPLIFRTKAQMVYEQLRDWIVRESCSRGNPSTRNGWPGCWT